MKKGQIGFFLILTSVFLLTFSSCQITRPPYDIKTSYPKAKLTTNELRVQLNELGMRFPAIIRNVSEEIRSKTKNTTTARRAVLFEANAIPMFQKAIFYNNPLISLSEIWGVAIQLLDYFEEGDGRGIFGDEQHLVLSACDEMVHETERVAQKLLQKKDYNQIKSELESWADEEGRLEGALMLRRSTIPLHTAELLGTSSMGTFQALSNINSSLDKISLSIFYLTERVPEYINWQSQLFMKEMYLEAEKIAVKFAAFGVVFFGLIFVILAILLTILIARTRRLRQKIK